MSTACGLPGGGFTVPDSSTESPFGRISNRAFGKASAPGSAQDVQVQVARDSDVEGGDLVAVRIQDEDRRGAVLDADHEQFAGRADHRVGDLRVGDEDFLGVRRKVDDQGAAGERSILREAEASPGRP